MPEQILDELLGLAGLVPSGSRARIEGRDPVYPTRFRMIDFGAAAIAASALQAARLYEQRTGVAQEVVVRADAAGPAMRSFRYNDTVPPTPPGPSRIPSAFYETRDGRWLFLHRAFAHHFERELAVLGLRDGDDEDAIVRAIRARDAAELEAAVMAAGACAAVVRTKEEWAAHPQGSVVAGLPLFRITKIGESEPIPAGTGGRPLGGLRVLDLTRVLAGPTNARTLAEHGADVLRIVTPVHPDGGAMPRDTGHGKRSAVLDLRTGEGAGAMRRLVAGADVFSQGFRPGALAKLGFSPEEVAEVRPGIVSVAISAFGSDGPWSGMRGFDSIVEAHDGTAHEEGIGTGRPKLVPASPLDYTSGYLAAFLVQVALERRAREGGSYHIELSLAQTAHFLDGLGRVDAAAAAAAPAEIPAERLAELMTERDTPYGRLRYLRPVAELSVTPGEWTRPSVPLDHDRPEW
ncbi:MAG: CoA transferase [Microbacteriaceae bacterium]|nr:CoA transferase [Microbacteriaceae bacterium]